MLKNLLILLMASSVVSCTPVKRPVYRTSMTDEKIDVSRNLDDVAFSVENSLRTLAATKEIREMNAINTAPLVTPEGGMGHRATVDWAGPIEPLLHKVAELSRYKVKVLGPSPAIPVVVSITAQHRMIADIVKDAGLQAGNRAQLVVYPENRIIELRYMSA